MEGRGLSHCLALHHGLCAPLAGSAGTGEAHHLAGGAQVQQLGNGGPQPHLAQREDECLRAQRRRWNQWTSVQCRQEWGTSARPTGTE